MTCLKSPLAIAAAVTIAAVNFFEDRSWLLLGLYIQSATAFAYISRAVRMFYRPVSDSVLFIFCFWKTQILGQLGTIKPIKYKVSHKRVSQDNVNFQPKQRHRSWDKNNPNVCKTCVPEAWRPLASLAWLSFFGNELLKRQTCYATWKNVCYATWKTVLVSQCLVFIPNRWQGTVRWKRSTVGLNTPDGPYHVAVGVATVHADPLLLLCRPAPGASAPCHTSPSQKFHFPIPTCHLQHIYYKREQSESESEDSLFVVLLRPPLRPLPLPERICFQWNFLPEPIPAATWVHGSTCLSASRVLHWATSTLQVKGITKLLCPTQVFWTVPAVHSVTLSQKPCQHILVFHQYSSGMPASSRVP